MSEVQWKTTIVEESKVDENGITTFHGTSLRFILFAFVMIITIFGMCCVLEFVFPLPRDHIIEMDIERYDWNVKRLGRGVTFSPMSTDLHEITFCIDFLHLYKQHDSVQLYHTVTYGYCFVTEGGVFYYFKGHASGSW